MSETVFMGPRNMNGVFTSADKRGKIIRSKNILNEFFFALHAYFSLSTSIHFLLKVGLRELRQVTL